MGRAILSGFALAAVCLPAMTAIAAAPVAPAYPETRRETVVEEHFGERIADPYRWLENDVRNDGEVADWVARENAVTHGYLNQLPQRAWFAKRIRELMAYERFGLPVKAGHRYFYTRNSGLQNQSQLFVREGLKGKPRLLIDPNAWAKDGATALDDWRPSDKGRYLLYSVQDGGTDWRVLRVIDAATGTVLPDEIRYAKYTALAWIGDQGFLYSRFPKPEEGQAFQARTYNQAVWFHRLGTSQDQDERVYATPDRPELGHAAQVTSDGRYVVITSSTGTDARYEVHVVDLGAHAAQRGQGGVWHARTLVTGFDHDWQLVDSLGSRMWFVTNAGAPRYRLVSVDLAHDQVAWQEIVGENEEKLERADIVGSKLVLNYLKDAASRAVVVDLAGKAGGLITLDGIGTASGFHGKPGDPETFYAFSSFNRPSTIYRFDMSSGRSTIFAQPELTFDPEAYHVEQRFYTSKDGTRVPMFIVRAKAAAVAGKPVPTLLIAETVRVYSVSLTRP